MNVRQWRVSGPKSRGGGKFSKLSSKKIVIWLQTTYITISSLFFVFLFFCSNITNSFFFLEKIPQFFYWRGGGGCGDSIAPLPIIPGSCSPVLYINDILDINKYSPLIRWTAMSSDLSIIATLYQHPDMPSVL